MTFAAFENSIEGGEPVEVYRFVIGAQVFQYTSAEDEVTVDGLTYEPRAIERGDFGTGQDERDDPLAVRLPASDTLPNLYVSIVPGILATVEVKRYHRADTPTPELVTIFEGKVSSVRFVEDGKVAEMAIIPAQAATSRPVPRFTYSGLCNHVLYDARCKVVESLFRFDSTVSAISSNDLTVTGAGASGFDFVGGYVEALGGLDRRLILAQSTDVLTLLLPFPADVVVGSSVSVFAGCDHTITTCKDVFDNVVNYGGFPFVPTKNPFDTGLD